jgi:hypothetical protein
MNKPMQPVLPVSKPWLMKSSRLLETLLAALCLCFASVSSHAGVTNDFTAGLGQNNSVVDAYPGLGDPNVGWVDGWTYSGSPGILVDDAVVNTRPFAVGGDYLRFGITGNESALRRKYTNTVDLDLSLPHFIEFDIRVDSWQATPATFTSSSDSLTLTCRQNYGSNPSGDSTYYIRAPGSTDSGAPFARANMWGFYNGDEFNNGNNSNFTNYFPFRIGTNYHFKIEQRTATKTYVASISAVVDNVATNLTTQELRWRSYSSVSAANQTNSSVLHFVGRVSTTSGASQETNYIALDNLHIYQAPLDEVPPLITLVTPAPGAIFYPYTNPVSFTVRTLGPTNYIPTSSISLTLNGTDFSGSLAFGGTTNNRSASFTGLAPNVIYRGVIVGADQAGRSTTNSFTFDTLIETNVLTLEAENYNFGTNAVCNANGSSSPGEFQGAYLQNPDPSTYNNTSGLYTNQATGYVDRVGQNGVDFSDTFVNGGNLSSNVFRFCDPVGTTQNSPTEPRRPAWIAAGVPDYSIQHVRPGEWLNYTHIYPNTNYLVYLRVSSSSVLAQQFQLSHVTSDRKLPNQTTSPAGNFNIPFTGNLNSFTYVPLTDALGNPVLVHLNGEETLRLTATTIVGSVNINFLLFVPQAVASAPPWLLSLSPSANASNVAPQTAVSFTIQNGSTPVDTSTIRLNINGSNVTSGATITPTAAGANVSYLPQTFFGIGSYNTIIVSFGDGTPATLQTNTWNFHAGAYLPGTPVRVNFVLPATTTNYPGYMNDAGFVFGSRGNGYNYGWDQDVTTQSRDRGTAGSPPDDRYKTLNQLGTGTPTRYWEIELPNGTYSAHLVSGDGSAVDSVYNMAVENVVVIASNTPTASVHWFEGTSNVVVADGRLTVAAAGGSNNKVCYIDIIPAGAPLDLTLHNPAASGPNFSFSISTINRAVHAIEYKNLLTDPTWTTLTNITGTGSAAIITDPVGAGRLYRMRIN